MDATVTKTIKVPNFKGYIELSRIDWSKAEELIVGKRTLKGVADVIKSYPVQAEKPGWIKELPAGQGVPAMSWKCYILIRGRQ